MLIKNPVRRYCGYSGGEAGGRNMQIISCFVYVSAVYEKVSRHKSCGTGWRFKLAFVSIVLDRFKGLLIL